ncbi:MAG: carbamate kinase, partial [Polaromonas sp.]
MKLVVALGGNALLRRGQSFSAQHLLENVRGVAAQLARVAHHHELVVTHGNGPQIGLLALQNSAYKAVAPYPLDMLGAQTEGMIGYLLEQELANHLPPQRSVATLLTRVEVDPADPAFAQPTKPIGPVYAKDEAANIAESLQWHIAPDGTGFRRVVASP